MSKYTTEVRYICESYSGLENSVGFEDTDRVIECAAPKVFNFWFPVFDEAYRKPLEMKILRHYYTREICEETVGLWKLRLEAKMQEIMPYYNRVYEAEFVKYDISRDVDVTTTHERETKGTNRNNNIGHSTDKYSDTPQGSISDLESGRYLTNASINDNTNNNQGSYNDTENYVTHVLGKVPGKDMARVAKEFRESIANVDMMIIDELSDLFFGLW